MFVELLGDNLVTGHGHFGDKQSSVLSFVKLLRYTLKTSRHTVQIPARNNTPSIATTLELHGIAFQNDL